MKILPKSAKNLLNMIEKTDDVQVSVNLACIDSSMVLKTEIARFKRK